MHTPSQISSRVRIASCLFLLLAVSCVGHRHSVGLGSTGTGEQQGRQYYVLFGMITANEMSAQRMADGVTSYEIETQFSIWDLLLQPFLFPLTMTSRTITVRT